MTLANAVLIIPWAAMLAAAIVIDIVSTRRSRRGIWHIIEADRTRERVNVALHTPTTLHDGWTW